MSQFDLTVGRKGLDVAADDTILRTCLEVPEVNADPPT
jgi:hypothetical protein